VYQYHEAQRTCLHLQFAQHLRVTARRTAPVM
jgi:hypothetical protein